jgi:arylformamidase
MNLDPLWLDKMYNNRALVPEYAEHFAQWRQSSALFRQTHRCFLDIAYGNGPNEVLDIFPSVSNKEKAPVIIFIHGGYWRSLDKSDHSFIAESFTDQGAHVVIPNYALCPHVSIPQIVMQMVKAISWTAKNIQNFGGDPQNLIVVGHSAGGHLATMMLTCEWSTYDAHLPTNLVQRVMTISGLYDLEPLRHAPFLADLKLSAEDALRASPAAIPAPKNGTLYAVVGANESPEFIRHNQLIQQKWGHHCVPLCRELTGLNHFNIVQALADSKHELNHLLVELIAK